MKTILLLLITLFFASCAVSNETIELKNVTGYVIKIDTAYRYNSPTKYFVYLTELKGSMRQNYMIEVNEGELSYYPVGAARLIHPNR